VAASSREAPGSTRRLILNLLEAFFRRPWLFLLPIVIAVAWGVSSGASTPTEYRSVGTISATRESLLGDLTQAPNNQSFSYETPATVTARNVNELLRTNEFLTEVVERAGIEAPEGSTNFLYPIIRQSVAAFADGENLVRIGATTDQAEQSQRLAAATLEAYVQWQIDSDVAESTRAEEFFTQMVDETALAVTAARDELRAYLVENPVDQEINRPLEQTLDIEQLRAVLTRAEEQNQAALDKREEARLATAQATEVVQQRLQVVDDPAVPPYPEPRLRKAITTVVIYGVLGTLIALTLLVVSALMDRSIRIPEDIEANNGLAVLAVVPVIGR
jgi:hypothetical protein